MDSSEAGRALVALSHKPRDVVCVQCGATFVAHNSIAMYCSPHCSWTVRNHRKRGEPKRVSKARVVNAGVRSDLIVP